MREHLEPGQYVRHPGEPDWGIGQVQSVAGARVDGEFEHAGKKAHRRRPRVTLDLFADEAVR